jgi:pimeloyl-ACP methyl ester carboxylesterase
VTTDRTVRVDVGGFELACLVSDTIDDHDRPLAVCLHGFPDSAHTWRHLRPALDDAGFRSVAPFLRGYAPSDVPDDGRYQTGASALDALTLHDLFGGDQRAVIVGHDWGAPIAYGAASFDPPRWSKVVGLAVPPGGAMATAFLTDTDQLKRSWYMFFFQTALAELVVPADDLAFVEMLWRDWSPGHDPADDLPAAKAALADPANLAAALGYYRATLGTGYVDPDLAAVQQATQQVPSQPMLYLHGADDACIGPGVAESARAGVGDNVTIELVEGTGHFLHLEDPASVNGRIIGFLTGAAPAGTALTGAEG